MPRTSQDKARASPEQAQTKSKARPEQAQSKPRASPEQAHSSPEQAQSKPRAAQSKPRASPEQAQNKPRASPEQAQSSPEQAQSKPGQAQSKPRWASFGTMRLHRGISHSLIARGELGWFLGLIYGHQKPSQNRAPQDSPQQSLLLLVNWQVTHHLQHTPSSYQPPANMLPNISRFSHNQTAVCVQPCSLHVAEKQPQKPEPKMGSKINIT